jgi:aspartyl-tRNA(Asn)/glutamyl-tRNA(Gln) amidotransferase subunit A
MKRTCREIQAAVVGGEVTAESMVEKALAKIAARDEAVGAFLHVMDQPALEKARAIDLKRRSGQHLGRLAGVPIAIKDNIQIQGQPTTCASRILTGYQSPYDATAIRLLEAEDAILIGKTNLDEFAMGGSTEHSALRVTRNPWDLERVPGGSSGGSAAAVAAGFVPASLGSDTGGSIRQPAAFCGLVGFKPTYGRVSRYGLVAFGSSLDQIGPFSLDVADAALLMEIMGQPCAQDSTSLPQSIGAILPGLRQDLKGVRLGIPRHLLEHLTPEMAAVFESTCAAAREAGATLVDIRLDLTENAVAVYYILATAEASTNLSRFDGIRYGRRSPEAAALDQVYDLSREQGFGAEVKRRILLGTFVLSSGYQEAYYRRAQKVRTLMVREAQKALESCDAILMPVTTGPAFRAGAIQDPLQMYLQDIFTITANLVGMPAVAFPAGMIQGMPVGVQLMGRQGADAQVLQMASGLEQHLPRLSSPMAAEGGI